jgi:hypothetical protein
MHWRWSSETDIMLEPSTDAKVTDQNLKGTPYLVPGQTIAIALVKYHPGEEDPDDPSKLLDNERIATARDLIIADEAHTPDKTRCKKCVLGQTEHSIIWYVGSTPNKNSDTFFRHGIFVLDTTPGDADPRTYMLSFSGEQIDEKSKFEGKTSGTAILNHDGKVINGKGKVEIKASHNAAEQDKLCEYEYKIKDPDYYSFNGEWKLEPSKTKQNPQGRIMLDIDSELKNIDLKKGPQSCASTYTFGHSLLLVCDDSVNIDIARKEGFTNHSYGSCKFKINY